MYLIGFFEINQTCDVVLLSEARCLFLFMFKHPTLQVVGYACIECTGTVGHDVYVVGFCGVAHWF